MTKAEKILNKCEHILDDYDADYRGGYVDVIDGTTYIVFKYYGGKHDTIDRNDDSWDEMYELEGVADVGYGSGYGMDNTKYEDMLLIELEDGLNESKKSTRKSIKESYDKWTTSTLKGELMKLGYFIDDLHTLPSKRHANEVIRQAETVINFCESAIYELKNAVKNNEV